VTRIRPLGHNHAQEETMPKRTGFKDFNIATNLRLAREASGMSQAKLAKKAGIGLRSLVRYENGERSPLIKVLSSLAQAMDLPISELFK